MAELRRPAHPAEARRRVTEVSATHYRVRGLSATARLGDVVEHRSHAGTRSGEIVQIGPDQVLVAPFEHSADAGIGDPVFNRGPFTVAPTCSWRGRVVDALGRADRRRRR